MAAATPFLALLGLGTVECQMCHVKFSPNLLNIRRFCNDLVEHVFFHLNRCPELVSMGCSACPFITSYLGAAKDHVLNAHTEAVVMQKRMISDSFRSGLDVCFPELLPNRKDMGDLLEKVLPPSPDVSFCRECPRLLPAPKSFDDILTHLIDHLGDDMHQRLESVQFCFQCLDCGGYFEDFAACIEHRIVGHRKQTASGQAGRFRTEPGCAFGLKMKILEPLLVRCFGDAALASWKTNSQCAMKGECARS